MAAEPIKSAFNLATCARPNILSLEPYRCARDDYKDDGTNILLDANENAFGPGLALDASGKLPGAPSDAGIGIDLLGLHRYPDPHQNELKTLLCTLRNTHAHTPKSIGPEHLFVGVGSDEAIDALLRAFCVPGHSSILTCPPTYGMYAVSAAVNDIRIHPVPLLLPSFAPDVPTITATLAEHPEIKLVYLCSPGNPTGTLVPKSALEPLLTHPSWNGLVVLDEAYIDFAPEGASLAEWVAEWPNLVVMQTLSKAFGLAGIRLGAAFCAPPVARLLNALKAPYNISNPSSAIARAALSPESLAVTAAHRAAIVEQRERLVHELPKIPGVGEFRGGFGANFVLVQMLDAPGGRPCNAVALAVYARLAERRGVVVRFRGKELGCEGCLRVTVGTGEETGRFLRELEDVLRGIYAEKGVGEGAEEEKAEVEANAVVA
ncbi:histidinol-phosphate aminotransferase [Trichodelitschia bisporula]|uniref:histidinol-phosphate transaminase n=1 Tax=Trichodelitschia bisporula TaxID=703511 RepID=A0A6G1I6M1_9PEZI|nr:histidinol-phosphate aminotransferase [Trichodelitschia bisporula]